MSGLTPKPGILELAPYEGGESTLPGLSQVIKLASNEGALGPSPRALEAFAAAGARMHRYPDGASRALRVALGERWSLPAEQIVCGAGSDDLLALLADAYAGPGDEVLYSAHGFLMYPIIAHRVGATPVAVPETDLTADVEALLAQVTERTRMVYLANPNNPTGTWLSGAALRRLREGLPERVLLVIDAAYAEFVPEDHPEYEAGARLVMETENTVMTRTFSKIYGLGGLRVGWAFAPPAVADVLNRVRLPFNVAAPAQAAAVAALRDQDHERRSRGHNLTQRQRVIERLRALGLTVPDSLGNFVLARFGNEVRAEAADGFLRRRGLIVRRMGGYGLGDSLRVSIGPTAAINAFLGAMGDFIAGEEEGTGSPPAA